MSASVISILKLVSMEEFMISVNKQYLQGLGEYLVNINAICLNLVKINK